MRIIFAGSPVAALPTLKQLWGSEHEVVAVLTRPDSPQGRKRVMTPTPIAQFALEHGIPVIFASKIDEITEKEISKYSPELGVVVAYGALLPDSLLSIPEHGWLNLHFSALPLYRGAAPVQWQLRQGEEKAGSSVFQLVTELDAGDIADVQTTPIAPDETSGELLGRLSILGAEQMLSVVDSISRGEQVFNPQVGAPTFAPKLHLQDARLDFTSSSLTAYNQLRSVSPEPGAWMEINGAYVKVKSALHAPEVSIPVNTISMLFKRVYVGCFSGSIELLTVQPAGKPVMNATDWFRGLRSDPIEVTP